MTGFRFFLSFQNVIRAWWCSDNVLDLIPSSYLFKATGYPDSTFRGFPHHHQANTGVGHDRFVLVYYSPFIVYIPIWFDSNTYAFEVTSLHSVRIRFKDFLFNLCYVVTAFVEASDIISTILQKVKLQYSNGREISHPDLFIQSNIITGI